MIKDEYRTETNKDVYAESNGKRGLEEHSTGDYSNDYVKWLETKLNNNEVLDLVMLSPEQIAKQMGWDSYYEMMLNEDHIESITKGAINMIFIAYKLKAPFD